MTEEMLNEVWDRMVQRGVVMDRSIYDEYSRVVSQLLAYDISRYVFGPEAEFKRRVTGSTTQQALLRKGLARGQAQEIRPAGRE